MMFQASEGPERMRLVYEKEIKGAAYSIQSMDGVCKIDSWKHSISFFIQHLKLKIRKFVDEKRKDIFLLFLTS